MEALADEGYLACVPMKTMKLQQFLPDPSRADPNHFHAYTRLPIMKVLNLTGSRN